MDLGLTDSQRALQATARDFVRQEAPRDLLVAMDRQGVTFSREIWDSAAALGWLGAAIPEAYGGEGLPLLDVATIYEELGRGPVPGPFFESAALSALTILAGGTEEQKRSLLPSIASGQRIFSLAAMDPRPHWEARSVLMQAAPRAGGYVLNGAKPFVFYAAIADSYLVAARTSERTGRPEEGITLFVVDRTQPGVTARELEEKKMEGVLNGLGEVKLENVEVPASAVLGEVGQGWRYLEEAATQAIPILCMYQVGGMESVTEAAITYSQTRVVFAQPIGRFQRVQDRIISAVHHRDSARWTTYEAIWKIESGQPAGETKAGIHMAKAVASEGYYEAANLASSVHGGIGIEPGTGLNTHIKMARRLYAHLGNPSYHRQRMVSALGF